MKTWTPEEVDTLCAWFASSTNADIQRLLPNKSKLAIYKKARKLGLERPKEIEFLNRSEAQKGKLRSGGTRITAKGYRQILMPSHPRADSYGYVMEHILVFERETGLSVPLNCCVHHLNGDKGDNRPENLCLMSMAGHTKFHHIGAKRSEKTRERIAQKAKERHCNA